MNKHVDNAYAMLNMPGSDSLEGVSLALHSLVESNLAVAYAQDTANLIAVSALLPKTDDEPETFLGERVDGYELARQITERLGL